MRKIQSILMDRASLTLRAACVACLLLATITGCTLPTNENVADGREKLKGLSQPATLTNKGATSMTDTPDPASVTTEPDEQGFDANGAPVTYKITTTTYKASATYDTNVLLNPSTDVIYPGSVLLGESIDDGSYIEVTKGTKRPVTVSFDLSGVKDASGNTGIVSGTIAPSLSNYRELKNRILAQTIPNQTSTYSLEKIEINSDSELGLKVSAGAAFDGGVYSASVKAGFNFDQSKSTNKVMVKFMQTFYTVDIDQGSDTFLYESFNLEDFGGYRPVYVSSIAYGRLAYITVESTESVETIETNLDAAFSYGSASADTSVAAAKSWLKSNAKTTITVIGGSTVAIDLDSFMTMLQEDTFSESNCGSIIAYKLRFVDDNTVANTVFNGEYKVRKAEAVMGKGISVTLKVTGLNAQANDTNETLELYGRIMFTVGDQTKYLWSCANTNYIVAPNRYTDYPNLQNCTWWNGTEQTLVVASTSTDFTVSTNAMGEVDDGANEIFADVVKPLTVSALTSGTPFQIKTTMNGYPKQYLEFTIVPTIEYLY